MAVVTDLEEVLSRLREAVERSWSSEARDVAKLRRTGGAYELTPPVLLYAESETREMVDYLWYLRSMGKEGRVPLEPLKGVVRTILELKADKWVRWYKMEEAPELLRQVASAVEQATGEQDLLKLMESLLLYMNRLNFWLDSTIPWRAISSLAEWGVER